MKKHNPQISYFIGILLSLGMLALMLIYTHAFLNQAPYSGFYFNPIDGRIVDLYGEAGARNLLFEGDILKEVGGISFDQYRADKTVQFFEGVQPGEIVNIVVLRDGKDVSVAWSLPGYSKEQFRGRFINIWWLGYIFWILGLAVQVFIRPRDIRWQLLIALTEVTGFWLILGTVSGTRVLNSSLLLRAATWVAVPLYLHLHWIFPRPLRSVPSWAWALLYVICGALSVGSFFQFVPGNLYYIGALLMFGGSAILLLLHLRHRPERREARLLLISIAIALLPTVGGTISGLAGSIPETSLFGLFALPFMPAAYIFNAFRRQLGGMEIRANRVLAVYAYLILLGTFLLIVVAWLPGTLSSPAYFLSAISIGLIAAYLSIVLFPAFQAFVDRSLLGIKLPYQNLPETFASRITTSTSTVKLLQLLEQDVFPSLLVRQFVFLQLSGQNWQVVLSEGVEVASPPAQDEVDSFLSLAGHFLPDGAGEPYSWVRLILSLKVGEELLGLWLLGQRDPDSLYHAAEIPVFQSLVDQTAVAISNLLQTERLRLLYQLDIERREQERMRLALELHDSVLNQLAVLRMNVGEEDPSPRFQEAYEEVVARLRDIVSGLRPPMLNYGLKLALEELVQDLTDRSENQAQVTLDVQGEEERYAPAVELHLFRIAQEACENAVRHAGATRISISGRLEPQRIELDIQDNGAGFPMGESQTLNDLIAHKHFGLAGIVERATLIGGNAGVHSELEKGTLIHVVWSASASPEKTG